MIIEGKDFNKEVFESSVPVIVDFFSTTCMPCKMLAPVMDEIEEKYKGQLKVCKIDANENNDLAGQFGIMAVPTIIYFKDGKETDRTVGLADKDEILAKVDL